MSERKSTISAILSVIVVVCGLISARHGYFDYYRALMGAVVILVLPYALVTFRMDSMSYLHVGLKRVAILRTKFTALALGWAVEVMFILGFIIEFLKVAEKNN